MEKLLRLYKKSAGVSTDSRSDVRNKIFFAIRGERFDGNAFAKAAVDKGCLAAVIDKQEYKKDDRYILVPDAKRALQLLATNYRREFDIPVICITGSNGKTTTKELFYAVLSQKYKTYSTRGNLNNTIGLPLSILEMPTNTELAIFEIGMSLPGEIKVLSEIAEPTHGIVTNIGKAHLEALGSIEAIRDEKGALYDYLAMTGGTVFYNADERFLESRSQHVDKRVRYLQCDVEHLTDLPYGVAMLEHTPSIKYAFAHGQHIFEGYSSLMGIYNFRNISAAVSAGKYFSIAPERIIDGISQYRPANNRSQVLKVGNCTVLMDAYNANPTSVAHALRVLRDWPGNKKMAILGDMLETGADAPQLHEEILDLAESYGISDLYLVGRHYMELNQTRYPCVATVQELKAQYPLDTESGAIVLIKGSRGIALEKYL